MSAIALAAPSIAAAMLRRLHGVGANTVGSSGKSDAAGRVRFLDCRIADEVDETAADFKSCRVPGAQLLRLADLDAATDPTARLPPAAAVLEQLRALGVRSTDALVLYDAERSLTHAPRALMLLRMLGAQNCSLLEGGLTEWVASNAPTHGDLVSVQRADPLGPHDNGGGWWSAYDQPESTLQHAHTPFHCRWADLNLSATPSELDECVALVRQSSKQAAPEDHGLAIFSTFARQKTGTGAMDVQDHAAAFAVPADASTAASDELPPTSSLSRAAASLDPARRAAVLDYEAAKAARRQSINARRAILGLPPVASIHTSARGLHSAEQQPNGTSEPVHSTTARSKFVTNLFSRRSAAAASREVEPVAPSTLEEATRRSTVPDASPSAASSTQANLVSRVVNAAVARSVFNVQLPVRRLSPISNNLMDLSPPPRLLPADSLAGHLRRISLIGNDLVTAADSGFVPINVTPDQAGGLASRPRSHAALDHPTILVACRSGLVSPLVVWALRSAGVPARWCIDAPL